jgi:hypothetical protein
MPTINRRISVSLTPEDESALNHAKEHPVLVLDLLGTRTVGSGDAAMLLALARIGLDRVRDAELARGYAELAASISEDEARERRAIARRPRAAQRLAED